MKTGPQFFQGFIAWRSAFHSLMELEQPEELHMSVAENCLPDQCRYVTKENDAPARRLDVGPGARLSQARKKRYNTKGPKAVRTAEPAAT
jgi:hypothetical protein